MVVVAAISLFVLATHSPFWCRQFNAMEDNREKLVKVAKEVVEVEVRFTSYFLAAVSNNLPGGKGGAGGRGGRGYIVPGDDFNSGTDGKDGSPGSNGRDGPNGRTFELLSVLNIPLTLDR